MTESGRTGGLSGRQLAALAVEIAGGTPGEAAEAGGCSSRSLRRWRQLPAWQEAVAEAKRATMADAKKMLVGSAVTSIRTLVEIQADATQPAAARVAAARTVLAAALDVDAADIADRLEALEQEVSQWEAQRDVWAS